MCGIFACVRDRPAAEAVNTAAISRAIRHRGPDEANAALIGDCTMVHARLSIIDISTGQQPMYSDDHRYAVVYNGEVYNFKELRDDLLKLGRRFRTNSDTEVVIYAYATWGEEFVNRLRGMFAFAIWDAKERVLFCGRDVCGEKPLYYTTGEGESIAVASEIAALVAGGSVNLSLSLESVDLYLRFGYIPPGRSIFREVHTLPPAHTLRWADRKLTIRRYWTPRLEEFTGTLSDAAEQMRLLMQQAVARQMVADVPVGAFLSGGLDSSTIVGLMQQVANRPVQTFAVGFGQHINELPYARAVARRFGTDHHEVDIGEPDVVEMLYKMAAIYDEPFADTSNIPTYLISAYAKRYVKVVLSGDGGDELFGGYAPAYPALVASARVPSSRVLWYSLWICSLAIKHRNSNLSTLAVGSGLATRYSDFWDRQVHQRTVMKYPLRKDLWCTPPPAVGVEAPSLTIAGPNRGMLFDFLSYLPGDILTKVDRASMAHGLETRAPFLDRDVVEFALRLPATFKCDTSATKIVLRHAAGDLWPASVKTRRKQGFGAPVGAWLADRGVSELKSSVFASGSRLSGVLPGVCSRKTQRLNPYQEWLLLVLGLWLDHNRINC